jgi:hypothetical protein
MTIRVCKVKGTWGMGILIKAPTAVRAANKDMKTASRALWTIGSPQPVLFLSYSTFFGPVKPFCRAAAGRLLFVLYL